MNHTIEDLQRTLESHSRELPLSEPRTVAVHRRIRRIRRQRLAAGASAVVAVAVVGALTVQAATHSADQVGSRSLPEYADGGRLIGTLSLDAGHAPWAATTTVVPTGRSLILAQVACTGPGAHEGSVFVAYSVNGKNAGGGSCGSGSSTNLSPSLTPGQPATVRIWLTSDLGGAVLPLADDQGRAAKGTHVRIGIYSPVPRSEYVFPPRPAHLESLGDFASRGTVLAQEGSGLRSTTVGVSGGLRLEIDAVEPGVVSAELDGKVVGTATMWTYGAQSTSLDLTTAELANLGIRADHARLTLHATGFADPANAWKAVLDSPVM